ncbi:conserved hypothetical protein [uncultured Paludibacter sp.]|uniref:Uncharacterized protein n=1 Tax=uncultured Paludibacter sp. TaxID=497635 RepID=A0A653A5Y0_9BACT|nr:conserved hypothetical protein [uncultured Paludibacter sp.]
MRTRLNIFSEFANSLFSHELEYLLSVQNFSKSLNLNILNQIYKNNTSVKTPKPFDTSVDKRTYSYMKNWITETLLKIDVDHFFEWLISTEKKILTDVIVPTDESEILGNMHQMTSVNYNFIRFYELILYYRDYLMVRSRTKYIRVVMEFLEKNREHYFFLKEINNELDTITAQIVKKTDLSVTEQNEAEQFLSHTYYNETLDGYTRYRAVVRLTIFYYNNRLFDKQLIVYEHLDNLLKTPLFYSKRILSNYYANRAMMHSKLNEQILAEKYGYLSLRNKNSDYLFYLINLCGVLIKQDKKSDALKLMRDAIPELKNTNNNYYKIGFSSFYIRTLIINNQTEKAVNYATQYFEAYKKEIFEHRWHLYLSSYFYVLMQAEKYKKIISLSKRYNLVQKEKQRIDLPDYLPSIEFYSYAAEYLEGQISRDKLVGVFIKLTEPILRDKYRSRRIVELLDELSLQLPEEIKSIKKELKKGNL